MHCYIVQPRYLAVLTHLLLQIAKWEITIESKTGSVAHESRCRDVGLHNRSQGPPTSVPPAVWFHQYWGVTDCTTRLEGSEQGSFSVYHWATTQVLIWCKNGSSETDRLLFSPWTCKNTDISLRTAELLEMAPASQGPFPWGPFRNCNSYRESFPSCVYLYPLSMFIAIDGGVGVRKAKMKRL